MTRTLGQVTVIAVLGVFFAIRLQAYAGMPVDVNDAPLLRLRQALQDHLASRSPGAYRSGRRLWRWWVERHIDPAIAQPAHRP